MWRKLEKLRADYERVAGRPFAHFHCPVLFRDEDVPLCRAHVVNQAFPDPCPCWTVLRRDVDAFYGSNFEADFVTIQYKEDRRLETAFIDAKLSKRLRPEITVDGKAVEYFIGDATLPSGFTPIEIHFDDGQAVKRVLKMRGRDIAAAADKRWEIAISKNLQIPALVSLIKAAHLTLLEMLGYRYALSAGGYFVGRQILGDFFLKNLNEPRRVVLRNADDFFWEFAHMARPVESSEVSLRGTVTDGKAFICREGRRAPWALIVFVRTSRSLHAVLMPILNDPEAVAKFLAFLKSDDECIEANWASLERDDWRISNETMKLRWPKSDT